MAIYGALSGYAIAMILTKFAQGFPFAATLFLVIHGADWLAKNSVTWNFLRLLSKPQTDVVTREVYFGGDSSTLLRPHHFKRKD